MDCTGTNKRKLLCKKYRVKPVLRRLCSENENICSDAGHRKILNEYIVFHLFDRITDEFKGCITVGHTAGREICDFTNIKMPPCCDLFLSNNLFTNNDQKQSSNHSNDNFDNSEDQEKPYYKTIKELLTVYVISIYYLKGAKYIESGQGYRDNNILFKIYCELLDTHQYQNNIFINSKIKAIVTILTKCKIFNIDTLVLNFSKKYKINAKLHFNNLLKHINKELAHCNEIKTFFNVKHCD